MEFPVRIDSRLRLPVSGLGADCLEEIEAAFTHQNPRRAALERIGKGFWNEPHFIKTHEVRQPAGFDPGEVSLPRGGFFQLRAVLRAHGHTWQSDDQRSLGREFNTRIPPHQRTLFPHQANCLATALTKQQGVIRMPTGSGKTTLAFGIAAAINLPTIVIVDSGGLHDQWVERAELELGLTPKQLGIIRSGKVKVAPLTIAMAQALGDGLADDLADTFGCLVFDEVQIAAAPRFRASVDPFRAKYRFGISADERRADGKEFLITDSFGPVIAEVSREELEDAGFIMDVEIRVIPTEFRADWYGLADKDDEDDDREIDIKRLHDQMMVDDARNRLAMRFADDEVRSGHKILVMSHRVEHCNILARELVARGISAGVMLGGPENRREFRRVKAELVKGKLPAAVGTLQSIGKGIDMPAMECVMAVTPIGGNKQNLNQVRGRACRRAMGKNGARLYLLWDQHCSFGPKHLKNILANNRRVVVWNGAQWVPGKEFSRSYRSRAA